VNEPKHSYELFGIECDEGWASLYQPLIDRCQAEGVAVYQIKEKFGGLRFYVGEASFDLLDAIDEAEEKSFTICEKCGEPGKLTSVRGWMKTLCEKHSAHEDDRAT
jgi:hypothetical protein